MSAQQPEQPTRLTFRISGVPHEIKTVSMVGGVYSKLGQYDPMGQRIELCERLPPAQFARTLLHEIMHALWWTSGAGAIDQGSLTEEIIVRSLETPLALFMLDNPLFLKWFARCHEISEWPENQPTFFLDGME